MKQGFFEYILYFLLLGVSYGSKYIFEFIYERYGIEPVKKIRKIVIILAWSIILIAWWINDIQGTNIGTINFGIVMATTICLVFIAISAKVTIRSKSSDDS